MGSGVGSSLAMQFSFLHAGLLRRLQGDPLNDDAEPEEVASVAWFVFWVVFVCLAAFDVFCLAPTSSKQLDSADIVSRSLSTRRTFGYCILWFCVGLLFNAGIFATMGSDLAIVWLNGYILEYVLSMDNVFFFHVVFTSYATPPDQIYKALFLGVLGAVVLRCVFYLVGAELFRLAFIVQILFGLVLIYSGYKTALSDDGDEDPRENRCVRMITQCLPLTQAYDEHGALLVRVSAMATRSADLKANVIGLPVAADFVLDGHRAEASTSSAAAAEGDTVRKVWRGTPLLLVVAVLQVVDVIFAVDSVTAKIAEYDSIFINFSSSAFAMLCLRSLYFVLVRLIKYFRFLKYGVAMVLVLIGVKLIVSHWVEVPGIFSLAIICVSFLSSMLLSIMFPDSEAYKDMDEPAEVLADATKDADEAATTPPPQPHFD